MGESEIQALISAAKELTSFPMRLDVGVLASDRIHNEITDCFHRKLATGQRGPLLLRVDFGDRRTA
jgi:hypothetical protein